MVANQHAAEECKMSTEGVRNYKEHMWRVQQYGVRGLTWKNKTKLYWKCEVNLKRTDLLTLRGVYVAEYMFIRLYNVYIKWFTILGRTGLRLLQTQFARKYAQIQGALPFHLSY